MNNLNAGISSAFLSAFVGAVAFVFCILFYVQAKRLELKFVRKVIPVDYACGKIFTLFSLYEKPRKLLHSFFWTLLVWVGGLLTPAILAFVAFKMLPSIGAASFLVAIVGLNLLVSREGFESYGFSREILAKQVTTIGAGDLDFVKNIIGSLRKSSKYFSVVGVACVSAAPIFFFLLVL